MTRSFFYMLMLTMLFLCCSKNSTAPEKQVPDDVVPYEPPTDVVGLIDGYQLMEPPEPERTIYIDPENTKPSTTGDIDNPHTSMAKVRFASNITIAFKRGTTLKTDKDIVIEGDNITLMSYGDSNERPVIESYVNQYVIVGYYLGVKNITIRDLEVYTAIGSAGITFNPADNGHENISIINCKLHGGSWGLRSMGTVGLFVENTEIYDTKDDGMFVAWDDGIEIKNCYIHDVNKNWQPPHTPESKAGGDAIQFQDCYNWHVHHNVMDRSSSGNKFCFISNNPNQRNGILEYNKFIGPRVDGTSVYIGDGADMIFRYNLFLDCPNSPFYSHAHNLQIYGNVFAHFGGGIYVSGSAHIFRNTFHDVGRIAAGSSLTLESNIFSFVTSDQKAFNVPDRFTESNNLYSGASRVGTNSFAGNPDFVDVENNDFRLGDNSDAVDRGSETPMTMDMDGTEIPQGNAPDSGAFEKVQ